MSASPYPPKGTNIHVLSHRHRRPAKTTEICGNTTLWFTHLEPRGGVTKNEVGGRRRAVCAPRPERAGMEGSPARGRGHLGPDGDDLARSFQKGRKSQQGSSFEEGNKMFQCFHSCLFRCRPHCVPELPGATQQVTGRGRRDSSPGLAIYILAFPLTSC